MLIGIRFSRVLLFALLLSLVRLPASHAQNDEPFTLFRDYIGLNEDQIKAIRNGKAVAKVIESRTPDEVFVFGSVYVQSTPEEYLTLASDIASFPTILQSESSAILPNCPTWKVSRWNRTTSRS